MRMWARVVRVLGAGRVVFVMCYVYECCGFEVGVIRLLN